MSSQPDLWIGWAQCAVAEGMTTMPAFVKLGVHRDCVDPDNSWAMLIAAVTEREDHESAGKRAIGSGTQGPYDQLILQWAATLAWGDI